MRIATSMESGGEERAFERGTIGPNPEAVLMPDERAELAALRERVGAAAALVAGVRELLNAFDSPGESAAEAQMRAARAEMSGDD